MKNRIEVCPACLSGDLKVHLKPYAGVVILRCRNCKNRVLSEWTESDKDYDDISLETYLKSIGEQRKRSACRVLDLIEKRLGSPGGRLLDIGCAFGFLLEEVRNRGWQTFGVEPNETVGRIARDKGLDVRIGHFPAVNFEPMQFDVICLMDVLEHLDDPDAIIRNIRKVLTGRPAGSQRPEWRRVDLEFLRMPCARFATPCQTEYRPALSIGFQVSTPELFHTR